MGSGKSAVSRLLREKKYTVIDCDSEVKKFYTKEHIKNIARAQFGDNVLKNDEINFDYLKSVFFEPKYREQWKILGSALVSTFVMNTFFKDEFKTEPIIFIEAACTESLHELINALNIKTIINVSVNEEIRHKRLIMRGMTETDIDKRSKLQKFPKLSKEHIVYNLENNGTLGDLSIALIELLADNEILSESEKYEVFKRYLDKSPGYCKNNTWCYAFYNSLGCGDCPFPCTRRQKSFIETKMNWLNQHG